MKRIAAIVVLLFVLSFPVSAEESETAEFYDRLLEANGGTQLDKTLPDEVYELFSENGINPDDPDWITGIKSENVFSHIWKFISSGMATPLAGGGAILAIILVSAAVSSFQDEGLASAGGAALYATALSSAAVIAAPVFGVIKAGVKAMQGTSVFMTAFVPVFAGVVASGGGVTTSVSSSALLLGTAQVVNFISSFAVMPLLGGFMAVSLASAASPLISRTGLAEGIRKLSFWIMSLSSTLLIGILGIQTAVNAQADGLAVRTAKFIVGTSVPVAGTALSEALTTVTASIGLLKTTVGIYGIVALAAVILPIIAELLIWRVVLMVDIFVGELFSLPKITALLKSVDTVFSVLAGLLLLVGALFTISLTVVMTAGK